ncbi:DUF6958 family protein [Phycisphaera mikurensis]|uniref:Restriction system protein Mrr-like N-terminal domain-containing protein n=1 Tax=Phycisphaera mikurensis (strain NBRC 102666 / KCTC 22515 / FYK2301M01) TaxID=1142394 RepID=I0IFW5_PHYMF|nr:hypothetical protein [Phycisphaera mikurensis]MBB6440457.1 hypothetical protein [Phycisphaera mikurensis]BAM04153.1 hypothetical protein PSMK_19940 [Phycisphaera mikurensis NBRC 102666]
MSKPDQIEVENVNHPDRRHNVDATKYQAVRKTLLEILPAKSPGLTQKQVQEQIKAKLPDELFPGGAKSGWWAKTVQLDLEAKSIIVRERTTPLRWYRS